MRRALVTVLLLVGPAAPAVRAQEPQADSRQELWREQRAEKARQLTPYEPGRVEKILLKLENDRIIERLLIGGDGFYPRLATLTPGSGIAIGGGYRARNRLGGRVDFNASAAYSLEKYWLAEAIVSTPRLMGGTVFSEFHVRRYDFPQEDFFGLGPDSRRRDFVIFALRNTAVGGVGGVRPFPWLSIGGGLEYMAPGVGVGLGIAVPSMEALFTDREAPGWDEQPHFLRYRGFVDVNVLTPRGNPRKGSRLQLVHHVFDDRDVDRYSFRRYDVDLQQFFSFLNQRRVLALHGKVSLSEAEPGQRVPFYLMETLGGSRTLRGYRRYRFRDENLILLQAEYRWEIFPALDAALFFDSGKVASRREDLNLKHLESNYGFGFRFGTIRGVFMRIDAAFGSRDGKHFYLRFGDVF